MHSLSCSLLVPFEAYLLQFHEVKNIYIKDYWNEELKNSLQHHYIMAAQSLGSGLLLFTSDARCILSPTAYSA